MIAALHAKNLEIVKELIENGAKINEKDMNGKTALSMAAYNGEDQIVKYLIQNGANVNGKFKNGDTILMWAASNGKIDIIKELISYGANINEKDMDGYTALFRAISTGNEKVVKLMVDIEGVDVNANFRNGDTALMWAAYLGRTTISYWTIKKL